MYQTITAQLMTVKEASDDIASSPQNVANICEDLGNLAQESFHILTLNAKNNIIQRHMITLGIADASLVHPREVFRPACEDSACRIILVHNHPSGDPAPSNQDISITKRLVEVGNVVGIKVIDHVVIGNESYYSFVDEGIMP